MHITTKLKCGHKPNQQFMWNSQKQQTALRPLKKQGPIPHVFGVCVVEDRSEHHSLNLKHAAHSRKHIKPHQYLDFNVINCAALISNIGFISVKVLLAL